jgi:hypothetical protein
MFRRVCGLKLKQAVTIWGLVSFVIALVYLILISISLGLFYDFEIDPNGLPVIDSVHQLIFHTEIEHTEAQQIIILVSEIVHLLLIALAFHGSYKGDPAGFLLPFLLWGAVNAIVFTSLGVYTLVQVGDLVGVEDSLYDDKYESDFLGIIITMILVKLFLTFIMMIATFGRYFEMSDRGTKKYKKHKDRHSDPIYPPAPYEPYGSVMPTYGAVPYPAIQPMAYPTAQPMMQPMMQPMSYPTVQPISLPTTQPMYAMSLDRGTRKQKRTSPLYGSDMTYGYPGGYNYYNGTMPMVHGYV